MPPADDQVAGPAPRRLTRHIRPRIRYLCPSQRLPGGKHHAGTRVDARVIEGAGETAAAERRPPGRPESGGVRLRPGRATRPAGATPSPGMPPIPTGPEAARRRDRLPLGAPIGVIATAAALQAGLVWIWMVQPPPAGRSGTSPGRSEDRGAPSAGRARPTRPSRSAPTLPASAEANPRLPVLGSAEPPPRPIGRVAPPAPLPRPRPSPPWRRTLAAQGRELFTRQWRPSDPRSQRRRWPRPGLQRVLMPGLPPPRGARGGSGAAAANVTLVVPGSEGGSLFPSGFHRTTIDFNGIAALRPDQWPPGMGLDLTRAPQVHEPGPASLRGRVLVRGREEDDAGAGRQDPMWEEVLDLPRLRAGPVLAQRNAPALSAPGLIDAMPEQVLLEAWSRTHDRSTAGRVRRLEGGRIGRFGWKAQAATLDEFVLSACANELGLEVPDHHQACAAVRPDRRAQGPGPDAGRVPTR